ncbi:MAG TPA: Swt1 family HEPN domain-containing protein [Verrucomicrobiae bacterium]|jgi:predicted AAA+ superfamily ATPase|nr:Swt1 family HEPN domain-containing protein [Verrucomicrobiae bacterium]
MALTNQQRVGKALDLLRDGLGGFIQRELQSKYKERAQAEAQKFLDTDRLKGTKPIAEWDAAALLRLMWESWNDVFRQTLGHAERTLVSELRTVRDRWAHQENFSSDDADRALDSSERLLSAISAPQSEAVRAMKLELRRQVFDEQVRGEKRKVGGSLVEAAATGALKPWREVITPHADVASGRYQQAEFAADLWQVHLGEGSDEYRKPSEFFRRTFLTESLKKMLVGGVQRLSGKGGDPVVQLQTNFGGGKTHSMLALYHLFSGVSPGDLPGVDDVMAEAGVKTLPKANRVVLVGNKISPGNPAKKPDGTIVRTLWGELAYQLGGKKAFARVKADDEKATSPGDALRELFIEYGPCLILIDEWVAYARQLHDQSDLPAGGFETQFSFAQVLTESAKLAGNCLLVISLPASDTAGSPHTQADDVEVGGVRGREALNRLRNVVGRVESSWRPATAEEGFEIVRRRLFEPIAGDQFKNRDVTAQAFSELYHSQSAEFPPECRGGDYEKRMRAAYPIHPEIFDQLYGAWSTLVKFQRTRGVLRLMAAVIHSLWEKGDHSPMILPSMIPIDDPRVQNELTRYLSDNWVPIIEKDVDGPNSLPLRIDGDQPNLGKVSATRRVARTIYLGSAPSAGSVHRGIEDRHVKLGCVMPGETAAIFGDGLRRLAAAATYLYQDGNRFWYDTQATVTKLAEDRAEQLKRDPDKVMQELDNRLREDLRKMGDFNRIHPLPRSGADVPDDMDARLIVLSAEHPYTKEADNAAESAARAILESRGNTPRLHRNTLVFLAADKTRLQDLEDALRKYIAWASILAEKESLNLSPFQSKQAETQQHAADGAVTARLPEVYQWLLVPEQANPQAPVQWPATRVSGSDALAVRASKKLRGDELLITILGSTILRKHLDDVPLWRGDHVPVRQLVDDFARYLYLPRLSDSEVLTQAIRDGVSFLTWSSDTFAYAESYDETAKRYRGLRAGQTLTIMSDSTGLLVKPDVARKQMEAEVKPEPPAPGPIAPGSSGKKPVPTPPVPEAKLKRFHGTANLDATRAGRDASRIADEILAHLVSQPGAEVTVTIEIDARLPQGATDQLMRTVTENSRTLKFTSHGFEQE